jgi:EpsI family protein
MKPWPFLLASLILVGTIGLMETLSHGERIPSKKSFSNFPTLLAGRWESQEIPIEDKILKKLQVSDYLMRAYGPISPASESQSGPALVPVSLYIGYYESQRTGATYHSPKNCLPGAGWNFSDTSTASVSLSENEPPMLINKVLIQKGVDQQLVLYWYQDRGRIIASEYWAKGYMIWDSMTKNRTDGSLVRIIIPVSNTPEEAFEIGMVFLRDMWPVLLTHMPPSALT